MAPALRIEIDSAGTASYHIGSAPDSRSQQAAQRRGIDLSKLRARQVRPRDFDDFDLILAMDHDNLESLQKIQPPGSRARLQRFREYAAHAAAANPADLDIPDPYDGDAAAFERVLDLATEASLGLIGSLEKGC